MFEAGTILKPVGNSANHEFRGRVARVVDGIIHFDTCRIMSGGPWTEGLAVAIANHDRWDIMTDATPPARQIVNPPAPIPKDVPNCRDRTCSGAVYERSQASLTAMKFADARTELAHMERRFVDLRDDYALEITWLKRELQRLDPRLYKARYERRSSPTGGKEP